ncbi:hypothetical protein [Paraburkholderia youngii]|uniref:hypothetical protein n=1 Tax=Paraburkholderia youngii TaxID=2782701 RepID=UPI003D19195C
MRCDKADKREAKRRGVVDAGDRSPHRMHFLSDMRRENIREEEKKEKIKEKEEEKKEKNKGKRKENGS